MNRAAAFLRGLGLDLPADPHLPEVAVAGGLTIAALAVGWWLGRHFDARAKALWHRAFGVHAGGIGERAGAVIRHGSAALLLAIIGASWPWPPLARLPIGIALAGATAWLTIVVLRGLGIARWIARGVGWVLFIALVAQALGGLGELRETLESVGFDIGRRRISLLSGVTILLTLVALYAAARLGNRLLGNAIESTKGFDATQKLLGRKIAQIVVVVIVFFVGIDLIGVDLTALAVFTGAFGLAIGFGFQKTFGNLISGIILLMDRSIKPGDVIAVGDSFGWVNKIGIRAVSVITRDGKEHLIPNEILMTTEVENWSYSDRNVRVHIDVGVGYDCDLKLAQDLMMRAAVESSRVLEKPPPTVRLIAFGENAVKHEIRVWISDPEDGVGNVRSDVLNRIWVLFREHKVSMPYPQRDIHIRSLPEPPADDTIVAPTQHSQGS
ncbi:mechanosensitive ion channel protein MscS [Sphingomonas gilva]|uniref:Mechanosensitive ion channel protein MscS n=1 Tax=Sphingomonas gilva TaxID=2305907 RepID=A0A396RNE5_9SPHN|nr:mechanosensitive ion channel domain-containing protein [Sphingomonas gilva]RHW17980.1 mechanosensitive ion channel protein MscS [Sphingomonas gilva]